MGELERTNSVLTDTQRDFLRNQGEFYTGEYAKQQRYERRKGIKKRVWSGFLDGAILLENLSPQQRQEIFDGWQSFSTPVSSPDDEERPDHFPDRAESRGEFFEKVRADAGFTSWLAFLYLGLTESEEFDFDAALIAAIEKAERSRGRIVTDLDFRVNTRAQRDIDELLFRFEQRAALTTEEMQRLRAEADVSDEEIGAYYDELARPVSSDPSDQ